jgi:hypothetical protein
MELLNSLSTSKGIVVNLLAKIELTNVNVITITQWTITLPHPAGLGDYTHTPLFGVCGTIFSSTNVVHQIL